MADAANDVLMRVVGPSGPLDAENRTVFSAVTDNLRLGFLPGKFCELREFSFSAGVGAAMSKKQDDAAKFAKANKKLEKEKARKEAELTMTPAKLRQEAMDKIAHRQDKRARKHQEGDVIDMQPVEFTRVMDCMSTRLFQSLVDCETLETISVIKRKAAGVASSGITYLRLDFNKVLMTNLDWKDGEHVIVETGTFIYRSVTIRYRPQAADGTLGTVIQQDWTMQTAATRR